MNEWLRLLIFLGMIVLGITGLVYLRAEMFVLLKGALGFLAILLIILAVISLWKRVHRFD